MTSSLIWTYPMAGSPRTETATAPSGGRCCSDESPHQVVRHSAGCVQRRVRHPRWSHGDRPHRGKHRRTQGVGSSLAEADLAIFHPSTWSAIRRTKDNQETYLVQADPSVW